MRLMYSASFLLAATSLAAQGITGVQISTSIPGAMFAVDGVEYSSAQVFAWPAGSKHVLAFPQAPPPPSLVVPGGGNVQTTPSLDTIFSFQSWTDNAGLLTQGSSPVVTVTAQPGLTSITANVSALYLLKLVFASAAPAGVTPTCDGAPGSIPPNVYVPGLVYVNGSCFWGSASAYFPVGTLTLNVFPFPGFVFQGWLNGITASNQALTTINFTGPTTLYPYFEIAKRVRFLTSPLGLPVIVDHELVQTMADPNSSGACPSGTALPVQAPSTIAPMCIGDFDFAPSSVHQIGAPSPATDSSGKVWAFTGWSGSSAIQGNTYVTPSIVNGRDIVTANYAPAGHVAFLTNPPGLALTVDGVSNQRQYNYYWPLGTTHQVSAPSQQTGSDTRTYVFQGWSNAGPQSQSVTVDQNAVNSGLTLTANYQVQGRLVVESVPSGLNLTVNGNACQTPCQLDQAPGVTVAVSAPASVSVDANSRLDFIGWSDGAAANRSITLNSNVITISAAYQQKYRLSLSSNPANAATFVITPASADSFYAQGTVVSITEKDNPGYQFEAWNGASNSATAAVSVTMTGPVTLIAQMGKSPYLGPAAVQNAVGATPDGTVAPGSVVSIFGQNLSVSTAASQSNPLPQALAGTSVMVDGRLLALMYVSPQQINAVLPPDLPEGQHTITVSGAGLTNVSGDFTAVRNAPGLFPQWINNKQFVTATHADGSAVTQSAPAQAGETITVLGTGFGPCQTDPVYGFPVPASPLDPLIDTPQASLGGANIPVAWAGCAAGYEGFDSVQVVIPQDAASGASLPFQISVNGHQSNTVLVPIQ
jgi:uncharacterized protein (TIGR03437 family)